MKKSTKNLLVPALFICLFNAASAADTTLTPVRIAVLAPLYLDSAFDDETYTLSNTKIPQYFLSGLEFYNGVMMAVDRLQKENANIEVWIYDTHKAGTSIQQLTDEMQPLNFSMIIASFSSAAEQKRVSDFSVKNSIPVISETYPTDAYLNYNPFFLMVNSTWKTHVNAMYDYLLKNYKNQKVVYFTKSGSLEDRINETFKTLNANHTINFSNVVLNDNFSDADVLSHLDSTKNNVVLCGTLNENFGRTLIKTLNDNGDAYHTTVIGMPTWSGMDETLGSSSDKIQIVITTPYDFMRSDSFTNNVTDTYKSVFFARPSDMVFKGYGCMYHFTKLLLNHPDDFINNVSDTSFKVFDDYDFEPIRLSNTSFVPDYLENKKIYFITITNGDIASIE